MTVLIGSFRNEQNYLMAYQNDQLLQQLYLPSIENSFVDNIYEGSGIYMTGDLVVDGQIGDDLFDIRLSAIGFRREVQMYQWMPNTSNTEPTQTYQPGWSSVLIDSTGFSDTDIYQNPDEFPYKSRSWWAPSVQLGVFDLDKRYIRGSDIFEPFVYMGDVPEGFDVINGVLYTNDPDTPQIGDLKISFTAQLPRTVSIIGQQEGIKIVPYLVDTKEFIYLTNGEVSLDQIIENLTFDTNKVLIWVVRFIALIGVALVYRFLFPVWIQLRVLPFFDRFFI